MENWKSGVNKYDSSAIPRLIEYIQLGSDAEAIIIVNMGMDEDELRDKIYDAIPEIDCSLVDNLIAKHYG